MKQIKTIFKLIKVDSKENSNKFWNGIIYEDGSGRTEWGRVGYSSQAKDFSSSSQIEKKKTEKLRDGYEELKVVSEGVSNLVPALDQKKSLLEIAKKQIKTSSSKLDDLISRLVKSNIHNITSSTQLKFDSSTGLFQTPVGVITPDAIRSARTILVDILSCIENKKYDSKLTDLTNKYLRLVPQNIGMKFDVRNIFPDVTSIQKQEDTLQRLESSYQTLVKNPPSLIIPNTSLFNVAIDEVTDNFEIERLSKWFHESNHSTHGYKNVKIKNFLKVKIDDNWNSFDERIGNIKEVWHGSGEGNLLSILKTGLRVSPPTTTYLTGKLFGVGHYGALDSSKSMQYTFGKFGGNSGATGWLFVMDFCLGNPYLIKSYGGSIKTGYDSIWAKKENTGLRFDELIVGKDSQVRIKYLLEVK